MPRNDEYQSNITKKAVPPFKRTAHFLIIQSYKYQCNIIINLCNAFGWLMKYLSAKC